GSDLPLNEGCLEALRLVIPQGSMLAPQNPAAVVAGNVETSQALTNALFGALGCLAAGQGTMNNLTFGNARHQYYETICGGAGAGPGFKGASAVHTHMTNSRLTDLEVLESRYPVEVAEFFIRQGSGGAGQWPGGDGVVRTLKFTEKVTVSLLTGSRTHPPFGLAGGQPGRCGRNVCVQPNGTQQLLPGTAQVEIDAGGTLSLETPGGGGFGPPGD
ncbi:MAG TPA: hydantoinase B/oxoprolinase family protein, partial [Chthoniobacterales bacterium]